MSRDGYIEVRGNRYSVPEHLTGQAVKVRIGLDGSLRVYAGERMVAQHKLRSVSHGWVSVPEHHRNLWQTTLKVEQRSLQTYEAML